MDFEQPVYLTLDEIRELAANPKVSVTDVALRAHVHTTKLLWLLAVAGITWVYTPASSLPVLDVARHARFEALAADPAITQCEAAKLLGISQPAVAGYCTKHNIAWVRHFTSRPSTSVAAPRIARCVRMLLAGDKSYEEISDVLGLSYRWVAKINHTYLTRQRKLRAAYVLQEDRVALKKSKK